jgi:hypothetical protein
MSFFREYLNKKPFLADLWLRLAYYQREGEEWTLTDASE